MSSNVENGSGILDTVKFLLAIALMIAAVVGFYTMEEQAVAWVRALGVLATLGFAVWIASTTRRGGAVLGFASAANLEVRKVIWPTRTETIQTTLVVLAVVVLVSIILWLVDLFYGWAIRQLVGMGG